MNIKKYYKGYKLLTKSPKSFFHILKFVSYMNRTALSLGMKNSYFNSPSGASTYSYSTAYDLFLLSKAFFKNDILRSFCSTEFYDINHKHIVNDALYCGLSMFDHSVSLKTGTWGETNKAICLCYENNIICVMANDPDIFADIFEISKKIIQGIYQPDDNISYYGYFNGSLLCHNEYKHFIPASTTKLLTALCVYNICNLEGELSIRSSDIVGGSGTLYFENEKYTVKDAVKIMLMESSNTLANSLANKCGSMI